MDRGKGEMKYMPSLIFPDLPIILKLGRLNNLSKQRQDISKGPSTLETRIKIKMTPHGKEKNPAQRYSRENPGKQKQLRRNGR